MATYSFLSVVASISGPGGSFPLGSGAAPAKEGITIAPAGDRNIMMIGADGNGTHSLSANRSGTCTVRLLKTSPVNAMLQQMYNLQTSNPLLHGKNSISVSDIARGDVISLSDCAFRKLGELGYREEAEAVEWAFDYISESRILGPGI